MGEEWRAERAVDFQASASRRRLEGIGRVTMVGSGKGGVGKSFVACGLALTLARRGRKAGLLDLDVHGASVPGYLGLRPPVRSSAEGLEPKKVDGLKVASLALFTGENPVPVRGEKKHDLINQLFALTHWGRLDELVVDLPPSTGDEVLSAFSLFAGRSRLVLVTTPSKGATEVVARLARLAEAERVPVAGVVVNMAYVEEKGRRLFPFGRPSPEEIGRRMRSKVVAEIPLDPRVSSKGLAEVMGGANRVSRAFERLVSVLG